MRYKVTTTLFETDNLEEALNYAKSVESEGSGWEFDVIDTYTGKVMYHSLGY